LCLYLLACRPPQAASEVGACADRRHRNAIMQDLDLKPLKALYHCYLPLLALCQTCDTHATCALCQGRRCDTSCAPWHADPQTEHAAPLHKDKPSAKWVRHVTLLWGQPAHTLEAWHGPHWVWRGRRLQVQHALSSWRPHLPPVVTLLVPRILCWLAHNPTQAMPRVRSRIGPRMHACGRLCWRRRSACPRPASGGCHPFRYALLAELLRARHSCGFMRLQHVQHRVRSSKVSFPGSHKKGAAAEQRRALSLAGAPLVCAYGENGWQASVVMAERTRCRALASTSCTALSAGWSGSSSSSAHTTLLTAANRSCMRANISAVICNKRHMLSHPLSLGRGAPTR